MNLEPDWGLSRGAGNAKRQKLTDEDVAEARQMLADGMAADKVAARLGVTSTHVRAIGRGARRRN